MNEIKFSSFQEIHCLLFQDQQSQCATLHALAENSQSRIKEIQHQYLTRSDEINAMLAEKHKTEVSQ